MIQRKGGIVGSSTKAVLHAVAYLKVYGEDAIDNSTCQWFRKEIEPDNINPRGDIHYAFAKSFLIKQMPKSNSSRMSQNLQRSSDNSGKAINSPGSWAVGLQSH